MPRIPPVRCVSAGHDNDLVRRPGWTASTSMAAVLRKRGLKALLTAARPERYSGSLPPSLTSSMNTSFDKARPMALSRRLSKALRLSPS